MITHYVYKITNILTGQYYIGKSSCSGEPEHHTYYGSGDWIRKLAKEKACLSKIPAFATSKHFKNNKEFVKNILEFRRIYNGCGYL